MARKKGKRPKARKIRIKRTSQAKRFVFSVIRNTYSLLRDVMRENEKLTFPLKLVNGSEIDCEIEWIL